MTKFTSHIYPVPSTRSVHVNGNVRATDTGIDILNDNIIITADRIRKLFDLHSFLPQINRCFYSCSPSLSCSKPCILGHVQFMVFTLFLKQRLMTAALHDLTVVHDNDKIRIPDG